MSIHDEKEAALLEVLEEMGDEVVWQGAVLRALVSENPLGQDLALGGFQSRGDCTLKILRKVFGSGPRPALGQRVMLLNQHYRITRVTDHPQYPMVVLVCEPED